MIRLVIFLFGFGMFLAGAASHLKNNPLPFDSKSVTFTLGLVTLSLDLVLIVAGVFLILIAWTFTRLNPLK